MQLCFYMVCQHTPVLRHRTQQFKNIASSAVGCCRKILRDRLQNKLIAKLLRQFGISGQFSDVCSVVAV